MFAGIKLARLTKRSVLFDELLLGLYTPRGIYIYRHDMYFGVSSCGVATAEAGYSIQLYGPCGTLQWDHALSAILRKLDESGCKRVALVQW